MQKQGTGLKKCVICANFGTWDIGTNGLYKNGK